MNLEGGEMASDRKTSSPVQRISKSTTLVDHSAGFARPISQSAKAIEEFDRPEQNSGGTKKSHSAEILLRNSSILMEAREYRLAVNLLRDLLIQRPNDPQGLLSMGVALRELGRYEQALTCFRALARTPNKHQALVRIAETYYLSERDEMALAAYRDVLKTATENDLSGGAAKNAELFEIYKNVGNIYVRSGDFEAAEEFYHKAHTLHPDSDVLMVNYGTLEIQRENFESALIRFRRAVEINAENDKAWVGLALVHRKMGDLELGWANVQRALDINPKNRTAIRLVVEWAVADQSLDTAISRLQEYLEADGEDAEMSFMLAKIFTHVGRLQDARLEMERVIALDPMIEGAMAVVGALDRELAKAAGAEKL
jgi:tetratricopeptide (TPR) repeat protein